MVPVTSRAEPSPLLEVRTGSWRGRRIVSPVGATELRVPAADLDTVRGVLVGAQGTDVYHLVNGGWLFIHRAKVEPTGFVVFAYPPKKADR